MGTIGGNLCLDTRCHFLNQTFFWRQAMGSCMKAEGDICRVAPSSKRCLAITSADLPPLLMAMDAKVRLAGPNGERLIQLADLYQDDGISYLAKAPDELLTEVILPPPDGNRAAYIKLRRRGTFDFPALGVAASIRIGSDGLCDSARIVLGAVTSSPMDMPEAESLVGQKLDQTVIGAVSETIQRRARPLHLADYDHLYRKRMVGLYVRRILEQLAPENGS
jgi:4-hydroxybenzoyl-CoA reductase subunit beta